MAGRRRHLQISSIAMGEYRAIFLNELIALYPESRIYIRNAMEIADSYFLDCQDNNENAFLRESICRIIYEFCSFDKNCVTHGPITTEMILKIKNLAFEWLSFVKFSAKRSHDDWMLAAFIRKACWDLSRDDTTEFNKWQTCVTIRKEDPNFIGDGIETTYDLGRRFITSKIIEVPIPPSFPRYVVGYGEKRYKSECNILMNQYVTDMNEYAENQGEWYIAVKDRQNLPKHLRWLIWHVVEGWSYEKIAVEQWKIDKESGEAEQCTRQAVGSALAGKPGEPGLAELLSVNL